jgi:hypothetical protein
MHARDVSEHLLQPQLREQQRVLDAIIRQRRAGDSPTQARQVCDVRRDERTERTERRAVAAEGDPHEHFVAAHSTHVC